MKRMKLFTCDNMESYIPGSLRLAKGAKVVVGQEFEFCIEYMSEVCDETCTLMFINARDKKRAKEIVKSRKGN